MPDLTTIGAALAALKSTGDTLKTGIDLYKSLQAAGKDSDLAELQQVAAKLAEDLYKARVTNLEVQIKLQEFQAEAKAQSDFKDRLELYHLVVTEAGGEIWELINQDEHGAQHHEAVCPICVVKEKDLYPLQQDELTYRCDNCGTKIPNKKFRPRKPKQVGGFRVR